ncbi:RNA polymerase sigma-70 factor (ECF subfamily) [Pedobacter sp. AK017]|uniref:RNA polymerase sigma factor n=1 Tax=Pedobacter sp. AK017 TaxID=2723073 RepID=UPI001620BEC8|nr:RNA polymerase sigma-70 factor [Pedobacter sp. AK017]MBB5437333.1 RNA polymerase sigma-70 factor (ECF subfamily) [Pedobacter sp. AK017]
MAAYSGYTDQELTALLKGGDKTAFTAIYERYHSLLYVYAHKKLHDKQESQDIIQEVLIALWNKRIDFSVDISLKSYLFTAVRNKALDLFAHKKVEARYLASLQGFIAISTESSDFLVREKDLSSLIAREIQALPPKMREIFELSRKDKLTHKQIAKVLNISEHTVATQMKRALKVLRLRLGLVVWIAMLLFYK